MLMNFFLKNYFDIFLNKNILKNNFFQLLIFANKSSSKPSTSMDVIGKSVMLEPFDHPGMLVVYQEADSNLNLQVAKHDHSVFCLVAGLDSRTLYPWRLKDIKVALCMVG